MIDVEMRVFDYVYSSVASLVPAGCFTSQFVANPAAFPFATLMEMDNITDTRHRGTADDEEFAIVTYEANVYAMSKSECRAIMDAIDTALGRLNFTRMSMLFVPNLQDNTIFRLTGRFQAAADANNVMYRRQ